VFQRLPQVPGAKPVSDPGSHNGVIAQSFATSKSPKEVLDFYRQKLDDWKVLHAPSVDHQAYRGDWEHDGRRLLVTALTDETLGRGMVQYNLDLFDEGAPRPSNSSNY